MRVERGVMVLNNNNEAFQELYADGRETVEGFGPIETGKIHDPKYCRTPECVVWSGHHKRKQLKRDGRVVHVVRRTDVTILPNKP